MPNRKTAQNRPLPETLSALYSMAEAQLSERLGIVRQSFERQRVWDNAANETPAPLITSCLTLQDSADIARELRDIYNALADGGLFLGCLIGGESFHELRSCLMEAEVALSGGAHPRMNPLPDASTLSRSMTEAGFALPVVDHERVTLVFDDLPALMAELRTAGCPNRHPKRTRNLTSRSLFTQASTLYASRYVSPDGGIIASVDVIHLHGWRH